MLRWRKKIRIYAYFVTDVISCFLTYIVTSLIYEKVHIKALNVTPLERISIILLIILTLEFLFIILNIYERTIELSGRIFNYVGMMMVVALLLMNITIGSFLFYLKVDFSRLFLFEFSLILSVIMVVQRVIIGKLSTSKLGNNRKDKNILVVGQSNRGIDYINEIKKHDYLNLNIVGYISIKEEVTYEGIQALGNIDNVIQIAIDYVIDEIAVARPLSYDSRILPILEKCQKMGITVTMLLDTHNTDKVKTLVSMVGDLPVLKFHTVSLNESQLFTKRVMDVVGASVGMFFFGIAYIIVGPLIKLETPGPIIFKQKRVGRNGRIFYVWKFRSMGVNAEDQKSALMASNEMSGQMFKMTNDPRVTKVGAFIRKTSIDELPQFFNVLKGEMSLVGTRPPTVDEVNKYKLRHHSRISITPGITGNWQVSGRSEIEDFEEVINLDLDYIANWSVWLDIKILIKTILVVVIRKGSK